MKYIVLILMILVIGSFAGTLLGSPPGSPQTIPDQQSSGSLKITSKLTCDCLHAHYIIGNITLIIRSDLQDDNLSGDIVSRIYLLRGDTSIMSMNKLSELSLPTECLHTRQVEDIEHLIIASADNMAQTLKSMPGLQIDHLISAYDSMVDDLYSEIYHLGYNHARTAVFYHSSIIHATKRLIQGVPFDQLCPAYHAYKYVGFFACEQEYLDQWSKIGQSLTSQHQERKGIRAKRSLSDVNEVIESLARLIACGDTDCAVAGCQNDTFALGWNIRGSDWGCCGDYAGCCYLAENTCFVHDAVCTCCTFKYFCVSEFCVPDDWCSGF